MKKIMKNWTFWIILILILLLITYICITLNKTETWNNLTQMSDVIAIVSILSNIAVLLFINYFSASNAVKAEKNSFLWKEKFQIYKQISNVDLDIPEQYLYNEKFIKSYYSKQRNFKKLQSPLRSLVLLNVSKDTKEKIDNIKEYIKQLTSFKQACDTLTKQLKIMKKLQDDLLQSLAEELK